MGAEHQHPHEQLTRVLSGRFRFLLGGREHELRPGDSLVIPPNVRHGYAALEAGTLLDTFTPPRQDLLGD